MRHFLFATLSSLGILTSPAAAQPYGDPDAPITAVDIDLNRYAGLWFEIARYPNRFERNCYAVTAEYTLNADGTVGVRNSCYEGSVDGPLEVSNGSARVEGPGQLSVNFVSFLPFIRGDYFVLHIESDYSMAVVGEPSREFGWILSRNPRLSVSDYDRALGVLTANGYDTDALFVVPQR